jgi:hypothetical protein
MRITDYFWGTDDVAEVETQSITPSAWTTTTNQLQGSSPHLTIMIIFYDITWRLRADYIG